MIFYNSKNKKKINFSRKLKNQKKIYKIENKNIKI